MVTDVAGSVQRSDFNLSGLENIAFFRMVEMLYDLGIRCNPILFCDASINEFVDLGGRFSQILHKLDDLECSVHVVVVRVGDQETFEGAVFISHKSFYIFEEFRTVFLSGID